MAASISDKLTASESGGNPAPTTVSSARSIGGATLACVALTNWPTVSPVHFITYKKKTDGTMDRTTLCLWKGIKSGTSIGSLTLKGGTDAGNAVGDFVEMAPTSTMWQDLYDGLTTTLNADGTLKDNIVTTAKINTAAVTGAKIASTTVTASNIDFTTFVNRPIILSGTLSVPAIANGGSNSQTVNFPAGTFGNTPAVFALAANGRLTTSYDASATDNTKATISAFNWSGGSAGATVINWIAVSRG